MTHRWRFAWAWFIGATLITIVACTPKPPPQPPQPPTCPATCPAGQECTDPKVGCEPKKVRHPELLLRQNGGVLTRGGQPHSMFGAIPCWDPLEKDHGGWAGFDSKWVDYAASKGANAFHMRLGPFVKDKPAADGTTWPNGLMYEMGPYINDDASQGFNQPWWDRALGMCQYAEDKNANCEEDLMDGWQCRHALAGDVQSPWRREDLVACGNTLTDTHRAFLRKAVETFGCEGGVIWQDGNEIGVTNAAQGPYKPAWTFAIRDAVRQYEQEVGCGVVHMFGTNSGKDEVEGDPRIDYSATHHPDVLTGPHLGKFREVNEHNPPLNPAEERTRFCSAKKAGQAWWYWRGAQSQADMETTLNLFSLPCDQPIPNTCPDPQPDPAKLKWNIKTQGANWWDPTPLMNDCAYCAATGQGEMSPGGPPRCTCPARTECPGFQCEFRVTCEQVLMQSSLPVWRGDGTVELSSNGWAARCLDCTWLEVCNGPKTVCKRAW